MAWKPDYVSQGEFRDWLRLTDPDAGVEDNDILRRKIGAASRAVDKSCHRQFGKADTAVAREYPIRWSRSKQAYVADIDDIMDTTALAFTLDGTALTADQWTLRNRNAVADGLPYTWLILSDVTVSCVEDAVLAGTGLWGWNAPYPDAVVEATLLQTSRLNARRDSPFGIAGAINSGTELRLLERLDPDIAPIVAGYVRPGWVAK